MGTYPPTQDQELADLGDVALCAAILGSYSQQPAASNSPTRTHVIKAIHAPVSKRRTGPAGCFESRTSTYPDSARTSTQLFAMALRVLLRQAALSDAREFITPPFTITTERCVSTTPEKCVRTRQLSREFVPFIAWRRMTRFIVSRVFWTPAIDVLQGPSTVVA
jgi:hypothetical protein